MSSKFGIGDFATGGLSSVGVGPLNVGSVLDTVDFVRKAWSSFGVPSSFAPTVDVDEIDRRIADLKAVEQWLNVNMNMLQGTIQALEIQRGTIATLKAYAGAFGAPAAMPGADALANALAAVAASASSAPAESAGAASSAQRAGASHFPTATGATDEPVAQRADPVAGEAAQRESTADREEREPSTRRATPPRKSRQTATAPSASAQPGLDPAAWWNLLQSQFNHIASAAISGAASPSPAADASKPAPNTAESKSASTKRARSSDRGAPVASGKGRSRSGRPGAKRERSGDGTATNGTTAASRRRMNKPG